MVFRRPRSDAARGAQYPARVLSLTLLDSYDNSLSAGTFAGSDSLPSPQGPGPTDPPADLTEMIARDHALGGREPVSELCATSRFGPDGRYIGPVSSSDSVGGYTLFGAMRLSYSAVTQPVLAILATMRDVRDLFPDIAMMNSADSARDRPRRDGAARARRRPGATATCTAPSPRRGNSGR
jgi:hypothetical protein